MTDRHLERERKFDVPADFELTDVVDGPPTSHRLRASYYDTDDARLQSHGVTLRRRVGGSDDGWHVKVPHEAGRLELRAGADQTTPPRELLALTRGLRLDRPLRRRVLVQTNRNAYEIRAPDGQLVAEVADDRVTARVPSVEPIRWREVEIELGPGAGDEAMDRLAQALTAAGARPASHGSKYAHAVGEPAVRPTRSGLVGLVDDYLQTQYERLAVGDLRMRSGENVVHRTRVAVRRVRSTLRTFSRLFDGDRATVLDTELSWYADALGEVRDLDVMRRRIEADIAADHEPSIAESAAGRLLRIIDRDRQVAWDNVMTVLDGRRYRALLHMLDEWRQEAPWTEAADVDASEVAGFVERARKKSRKRLARATADEAPDAMFHRARKAAKRTRYAADLARPELGKRARRLARTHQRRQDDLGVLQDHVMIEDKLHEIATRSRTPSHIAFTCGLLAQQHRDGRVAARSALRVGLPVST